METSENVETKVTTKVTDAELDGMIGRAFVIIAKGISYAVMRAFIDTAPVLFCTGVFVMMIINTAHMITNTSITSDGISGVYFIIKLTFIGTLGILLRCFPNIDRFMNWLNPDNDE
jgi:hypothetical protein